MVRTQTAPTVEIGRDVAEVALVEAVRHIEQWQDTNEGRIGPEELGDLHDHAALIVALCESLRAALEAEEGAAP